MRITMGGYMLPFDDSSDSFRTVNRNVDDDFFKSTKKFPTEIGIFKANKKQCQMWLEKNKTAIENYNRSIEEGGVFSDELRCF
jgi:post-segregation antitoxin (ccd killing protein)